MSADPYQPRPPRDGWPEQPPPSSRDQRDPGYPGRHRDAGEGGYPHEPPRRRRRGCGCGTALLITLVVLVAAFAVIDQVARNYAQNKIAAKIVSNGFPQRPAVSIKGWPFLTQVLGHNIGRVDLSASNVRESTLDIASINATATGVHIDSGYNSATIAAITGTGLITFSSLAAATGASGLTISDDPSAGPNTARISVGPLYGTASVTRSGASSITVKADSVGRIPLSALGQLADYTIDIPHLLAGMEVSGVSVEKQGVVIQVSAHNTTLTGSGTGSG